MIEGNDFVNPYVQQGLEAVENYSPANPADLEAHTRAINAAMDQGYERQRIAALTGVEQLVSHDIFGQVHLSHIRHQEALLHRYVSLKDRIRQEHAKIDRVNQIYAAADGRSYEIMGENPEFERNEHARKVLFAASRLAAMPDRGIVSDLDGTLTRDDGYYPRTVPGTHISDTAMARVGTRRVMDKVFPAGWGQAVERFSDHFIAAGQNVPMLPGVDSLFRHIHRHGGTIDILTASMDPFVRGTLSQLDTHPLIRGVHSIQSDDVSSNYKHNRIKGIALENPDRALVYMGDSSSDNDLADPDMPIAFAFALEGGSFARKLESNNLIHFTFPSDHRVTLQTWIEIETLADMLRAPESNH